MKCSCNGKAPVIVICIDCLNLSTTKAYMNGYEAAKANILEAIKKLVRAILAAEGYELPKKD